MREILVDRLLEQKQGHDSLVSDLERRILELEQENALLHDVTFVCSRVVKSSKIMKKIKNKAKEIEDLLDFPAKIIVDCIKNN